MDNTPVHRIPVGISSCLLGEAVRYDGGHRYDCNIHARLAPFLELRPYCPEVAIGLGVPRPPIRLVHTDDGLRVRGVQDGSLDVTTALAAYGHAAARRMDELCGYIFKARSPSCGMERVRTYHENGRPGRSDGVGAFAAAVMQAHPNLPVEEESRLRDAELCENFLERVFTRHRWLQLQEQGVTPARLVAFHTRHKLAVMVHNQSAYRRLGRLVAAAGRRGFRELCRRYERELMAALQRPATRQSHCNVLQHLQGYFSKALTAEDRAEMSRLIEDYRLGRIPLAAPLTLIRHQLRHHPNGWALSQTYLEPFPRET